MKVVLLNTSESSGGAAIAANRLFKALLKQDVEANMLVLHKQTDDPFVKSVNTSFLKRQINKLRFLFERLVIFFCNHFDRNNLFKVSIANTGTDISRHPLVAEADIIHLHWINQGFLSLSDIQRLTKLGKPIVWTMHDMWPFTAICHYTWECEQFKRHCGECPFLSSRKEKDLAYRLFQRKEFQLTAGITYIAVSGWLRDTAWESELLSTSDVSMIPNVIDISMYSPSVKEEARKEFSLPMEKKIILMGAMRLDAPIKGFSYLLDALDILAETEEDYFLVLFGDIKEEKEQFLAEIPIGYVHLGLLSDPKVIARLYAAADVTVVPSHYETFGQTLIEAMACGCPVVSFSNSGQTDIIDHKKNGYLASYYEIEDLANGIQWVVAQGDSLSEACIKKIHDNFTEEVVSRRYIELYKSLLQQ